MTLMMVSFKTLSPVKREDTVSDHYVVTRSDQYFSTTNAITGLALIIAQVVLIKQTLRLNKYLLL